LTQAQIKYTLFLSAYKDLQIFSIDGKVIPVKQINKDYIELDELAEGVDFITFILENNEITNKTIKP